MLIEKYHQSVKNDKRQRKLDYVAKSKHQSRESAQVSGRQRLPWMRHARRSGIVANRLRENPK
jgi:hypothetical protein